MAIGNAWVDGSWIDASWIVGAWQSGAECALAGTIITASPADIVAGGQTIILELTGDTWVAAGATFNAQRQAIIDGLTSAGAELAGWNAEVRDKEVVTAVARTSDTVVTITLTAAPAYAITASETITATVPAAALVTSAAPVVATPTFALVPAVEEEAAPPGVGGGEPSGRRRAPFTGRGLFPDAEGRREEEKPVPARVEPARVVPSAPAEVTGAGLDELAAARARRDARREAERAAERARIEALRAEDGRRLLAFLEAEAEVARAVERQRLALLADDEGVLAAYLEAEQALRDQLAGYLAARQRDNALMDAAAVALRRALAQVLASAGGE